MVSPESSLPEFANNMESGGEGSGLVDFNTPQHNVLPEDPCLESQLHSSDPHESSASTAQPDFGRWPHSGFPPRNVREYYECYLRAKHPEYDDSTILEKIELAMRDDISRGSLEDEMQLDEEIRQQRPDWTTWFYYQ
jgi:hypothetical protein